MNIVDAMKSTFAEQWVVRFHPGAIDRMAATPSALLRSE
jgi:hypothetical protein